MPLSRLASAVRWLAGWLAGGLAGQPGLASQAHLRELDGLQGQLAEHVGVAVEQDVPEVVHLAAAGAHVGQLLVIYEPVAIMEGESACVMEGERERVVREPGPGRTCRQGIARARQQRPELGALALASKAVVDSEQRDGTTAVVAVGMFFMMVVAKGLGEEAGNLLLLQQPGSAWVHLTGGRSPAVKLRSPMNFA